MFKLMKDDCRCDLPIGATTFKSFCPRCEQKFSTAEYDKKGECIGTSHHIGGYFVPRFCPNCGEKISNDGISDNDVLFGRLNVKDIFNSKAFYDSHGRDDRDGRIVTIISQEGTNPYDEAFYKVGFSNLGHVKLNKDFKTEPDYGDVIIADESELSNLKEVRVDV